MELLNMNCLYEVLGERGVSVSVLDEKVTAISCTDTSIELSYTISNGTITSLHFKQDEFEIDFSINDTSTVFQMKNYKFIHSAISEN